MPRLPERQVRAGLPLLRFFQTCLPLPLARRLLTWSLHHTHLDPAIQREAVLAGGVPCEWLIPPGSLPGQVLLYLHGGGFVYGLTPPHLHMGAYLARKLGIRLLMVDYRLAPQYPFPAALDDCVTVYRWLLSQGYSAENLAIAGDSAGGNLTIATLLFARDHGLPLPAAAACLSPVIDLTDKDNHDDGFKDPLLPSKAMQFYTSAYVAHSDARTPLLSPAYADLSGLPPLLIHAGEDEILRSDAERLASLAKAAGVDVRLEIYPRMWHVWQINLTLPQAIQSLEDIIQFLRARLDK